MIVAAVSVVLQLYVSAPVILKVTVWFEQIKVLEAVAFNVGTFASAVMFTVPVDEIHPLTVLVT